MAHLCAFCSSNFFGKRMPDVGQWDFYRNLRLKNNFFSKWLNCAVSFVKFATLSRSGGTQIPNFDTYSNSVGKALGCKLRGMSER